MLVEKHQNEMKSVKTENREKKGERKRRVVDAAAVATSILSR